MAPEAQKKGEVGVVRGEGEGVEWLLCCSRERM